MALFAMACHDNDGANGGQAGERLRSTIQPPVDSVGTHHVQSVALMPSIPFCEAAPKIRPIRDIENAELQNGMHPLPCMPAPANWHTIELGHG